MQLRIKLLALLFILVFVGLITRLFFWQIIRGKELAQQAKNQHQVGRQLSAPRGNILASDGTTLAARAEGYLVFAEIPKLESNINDIADKLSVFFVEDPDDTGLVLEEAGRLKELLSKKESVWVPLKQRVSSETKKNIEALKIKGIGFERSELRIYPEASAAAHLLGFVGKDEEGNDMGYFGLEGYYDLTLAGRPGFEKRESDAKGNALLVGDGKKISALSGVTLETKIDRGVQTIVEKRLKEGMERYGAKAGSVIVMDPNTGAILAMSSLPGYEPGRYWEYGNEFFKNPVVSDSFEPGSIFKIVVMASGLDAGVVKPDTKCEICGEPLRVDKYTIETWNREYDAERTMTDVIVNSDNVGMSFVGQKLGADTMYDYLSKFGFGETTGVDLQGEGSPKLREKGTWNIVDLATASFGQGIAVTPIQMITAASSIANGGYKVKPFVTNKLIGEGWEEEITPKKGDKILSDQAVADIKAMMIEAVKHGESKWTYLKGFSVAGKTGTAQIAISGHYDEEKTNASFIAFAPADKPKFIMLVMLKEPQTSQWASETAAPLWYSIAKDLFPYFNIQPED